MFPTPHQEAQDSSRKIPRILFQTWETRTISAELQDIINTWKEKNPEYEYIFHDASDREAFIKANFEKNIYDAYCKIVPGAYKADLWRYCILYTYGGVYVDIDTLCLGSIDAFLKDTTEFMAPVDLNTNPNEGNHNVSNGFIAVSPKNSIMLGCIKRVVFHLEYNLIPYSKLDFSGPGALGREVNISLKLSETDSVLGKQGHHETIHFLTFEPGTEYIKDSYGNVLLQNKNGNEDIKEIYSTECDSQNVINWMTHRPF